jgi:hypothetical protein
MTATTIVPADVIREAHAAYHLALSLPESAGIDPEITAVRNALEACGKLGGNVLDWTWTMPSLADEADRAALLARVEAAESATGALIAAMADFLGVLADDDILAVTA